MRRFLFSLLVVAMAFSSDSADAATETQFFNSDGVTIRYTLDGPADGEPVLLIHGFSANGLMNWKLPGVVAALDKDYRVITIDNRGHGGSDKPLEPSAYGAKMAEDSIRLLDHLKIDKAHLVGYSMGGMITLKILATHPQRVASAVVGGMGWVQAPDDADWLEQLNAEPAREKPLDACRRGFPGLGITSEQLKEIKVPLTVIIGTDDRLGERVDALLEVRPDVPVVEIEGANHVNCVMRPELREGIKKFLDAHQMKK